MKLRTARSVADFIGAPDDPDGYTDSIARLWDSGASRPGWSFVLEDGGGRIGRIGYRIAETCPGEFLGDLPPHELFVYGWWLPWEDAPIDVGTELICRSVAEMPDEVPDLVQARINREFHSHVDARVTVAEAVGLRLFQEKQGVLWEDSGTPIEVPDRLRFRTVTEAGRGHFRRVLGGVGRDTLDRNDRHYYDLAGEENWSNVFMTMLDPDDAEMWLVASLPDGPPVGFVAVSEFDEPDTATITFVGVLPAQRGHRYIDDLLLAGTAAAQRHGFRFILSDVDTENAPMLAAMERNGHLPNRRPWHVWHYRGTVAELSCR